MTQAKTPSLEEIRVKLDAIDDQILKLVDERSALAQDVAAAKRARGEGDKFALRPARESQIIRRMLAQRKTASAGLVVRIWREIIGDNLYHQTPVHIAAWGGRHSAARVTELARQRFGAAPALVMMDEPDQAISTAKHTGGVAVLARLLAQVMAEPYLLRIPDLASHLIPHFISLSRARRKPGKRRPAPCVRCAWTRRCAGSQCSKAR